jgi:excisionase family DNA binding protein
MTPSDKLADKRIAAFFAAPAWAERFPPFLTADQAAELAQIPKQTIYSWSSRGLLADCSVRVGKHLRIIRDDFVRLILAGQFGNERR